ncbi:nudix hydrolase 26, chloroplastic [Coffea eugenioides]|uniref:nudix hydrolase 26, chloroplastic n=1 Tax=Coffea eugenioides TaxID=49369 RepID=UPI000F613BF9|nr:nudix hydrolase 26, chloroplastic [Coffea eugenioides]
MCHQTVVISTKQRGQFQSIRFSIDGKDETPINSRVGLRASVMALCLCRYIILSCHPRHRHQALSATARNNNFSSLYCPPNHCQKFTSALSIDPHHRHKRFRASFCAQSSSIMQNPPQGYRRNVGICLMNPSSKKIFAASRLDIPDAWQMPQGGIDESEDPRTAAARELREETGVTTADIVAEVPYWLTYDFPPAVREKLNRQWGSDWKGQAQKWFLFKFNGNDDEINLLGDGTEKAEFGEWAWMSAEQVINHAVDFKKPVYEEVLSVFSTYLQ